MNWRFCPHCETQLDDATGICPACRWDPLDEPAAVPAEPELSLMERYRGTEYDSLSALAPMVKEQRSSLGLSKARTWLLVGVVALFGIYGALIAWTTYQDGLDRPAIPVGVSVGR